MPDLYEDAELPDGVKLYDFEDFDTHRKLIFDDAQTTLLSQFPKVHNGVRMELADVAYVDKDNYTISDQKRALHEDKYLTRRLRGTVRLVDDTTDDVLDEKSMTLMRVPYLTERGTFIRDGNEWASIAQQRLLPGAYTRLQNNGDLETQFNVRPGTGHAFRVNFNPESTQYRLNINGGDIHLYSLLHDLGVSDDELKNSWGEHVFQNNADKYDTKSLDKAYTKVVPEWDRSKNEGRSRDEKIELIKGALNRSQMVTAVAKKTLPNIFSQEKKAEWRAAGPIMEKCASMNKAVLEDVAIYLGAVSDNPIATDGMSKERMLDFVKSVVTTGLPDSDLRSCNYKETDTAAALVRQMRAKKVYTAIRKKLNLE